MEKIYAKHLGKGNVSVNLVSRADVRALFPGRLKCGDAEWRRWMPEVTLGEKVSGESGQVRLEGETSAEEEQQKFLLLFSSYHFRFSSSSCILEALYRSQAGSKSSPEGKRFWFVSN